jgi:hypothetical protein
MNTGTIKCPTSPSGKRQSGIVKSPKIAGENSDIKENGKSNGNRNIHMRSQCVDNLPNANE